MKHACIHRFALSTAFCLDTRTAFPRHLRDVVQAARAQMIHVVTNSRCRLRQKLHMPSHMTICANKRTIYGSCTKPAWRTSFVADLSVSASLLPTTEMGKVAQYCYRGSCTLNVTRQLIVSEWLGQGKVSPHPLLSVMIRVVTP